MCSNSRFVEKCDVLKLVTEIKKHPCLYDFTSPDHADRDKTAAAWLAVSNLLGCPVRDCKEKWRKIRIAFGRFLKLSKSSNPPTRAYHLSDYLQFLVPFVKTISGPASPADQITNAREEIEANHERVKVEDVSDEEEIEILDYHTYNIEEQNLTDNESYESPNDVAPEISMKREHLKKDTDNESYESPKEDVAQKIPIKRKHLNEDYRESMSPRKMFLLSLLPDVEALTEQEMRIFRRRVVIAIDDIINERE